MPKDVVVVVRLDDIINPKFEKLLHYAHAPVLGARP